LSPCVVLLSATLDPSEQREALREPLVVAGLLALHQLVLLHLSSDFALQVEQSDEVLLKVGELLPFSLHLILEWPELRALDSFGRRPPSLLASTLTQSRVAKCESHEVFLEHEGGAGHVVFDLTRCTVLLRELVSVGVF